MFSERPSNESKNRRADMIDKKLTKIENKIIEVREQKVILDSDVAELYSVGTKDINRAVKNNRKKFPEGYVFSLSQEEKLEVVKNFHHNFPKHLPKMGFICLPRY